MRFGVKLPAITAIVSTVLIAGAQAQPSDQRPGNDGWQVASEAGSVYDAAGVTPGTDAVPARLSDGTLAESVNTTALATSTYHQPTGFLPGMKP